MNIIENYDIDIIDGCRKQDKNNPKYLFHGTSIILDKLESRQSHDSYNKENEDFAVFLTSDIDAAAAYAFRSRIKELTKEYGFNIDHSGINPVMDFYSGVKVDDLFGYIYFFENEKDIIQDKNTTQYRYYHSIAPVKVMKVRYKDFEDCFKRLSSEEFNRKYKR